MRISAISLTNYQSTRNQIKKHKLAEEPSQQNQPAFKGTLGQSAGSALGMFCGVVATFFTGPIGALVITGIGCVGGGIAGDKIEDKMNEKK